MVFFILRRRMDAAYLASGAFLTVMLLALLAKGTQLVTGSVWAISIKGAWLVCLVWLLWRVVPHIAWRRGGAPARVAE